MCIATSAGVRYELLSVISEGAFELIILDDVERCFPFCVIMSLHSKILSYLSLMTDEFLSL